MESTASSNTFSGGVRLDWWRIACVAVLGIGVLLLCQGTRPPNDVTESGVNMDLPIFVDQFMGMEESASLSETTMLPKDTQFAKKIYTALNGYPVVCQIVLSGGEKRSIHRPEVCLPGQGWTIRDGRPVSIKLSNGSVQQVMKLTLDREIQVGPNQRRRVTNEFLYWFVGKDKTTANHWQRVLLSSWDRVMHNVNHRWAYVVVSSIVPPDAPDAVQATEKTVKTLEDFVAKIAPQLQKPGVVSH